MPVDQSQHLLYPFSMCACTVISGTFLLADSMIKRREFQDCRLREDIPVCVLGDGEKSCEASLLTVSK